MLEAEPSLVDCSLDELLDEDAMLATVRRSSLADDEDEDEDSAELELELLLLLLSEDPLDAGVA
jgi:hypothetical protein